ncbi:endonuclease [Actinomadura logoneensis]|uniref:phospholipase D n=1 Tax=Actinomadura logoneensis TaxID=2293572 RepID=A0A372JHF2_9ACTN|nr:DISARM system phospholipase D-like protein DrmC [Actinomadura logoneensis]RFU39431.1 endonuclease [Actinomadura logoneensis]
MNSPLKRFASAAAAPAARLGPTRLRVLADRVGRGDLYRIREAMPEFAADVEAVLAARDDEGDLPSATVAAFLEGMAAALAQQEAAVRVESVWSGPVTHAVPVRSTAQVLAQLIGHARHELILMTYSAKPHPPVRDAIAVALERGVRVRVVVETLQGAGSAISGEEPAAAFHGLNVELWHWPVLRRPGQKGKMHAKIAVADRRELLVTSANLTQSGADANIEAGLLVRGGSAPQRAAEHVDQLRTDGVLERL